MKTTTKGFSLIEVIVAGTIFLLLLGMIFVIYRAGADTWMKSDANSELLGKVQKLTTRMTREAERSTYLSASPRGPRKNTSGNPVDSSPERGFAFLTPVDNNGVFQFDPTTRRPLWQNYVIYFHDPATRTIRRKVLAPYFPNTTKNPRRIESDRGASLAAQFSGGQTLIQEAKSLTCQMYPATISDVLDANYRMEVILNLEIPVRGQTTPRTIESKTMIRFRN